MARLGRRSLSTSTSTFISFVCFYVDSNTGDKFIDMVAAVTRLYEDAVPQWQRFQSTPESPYSRQYSHVYSERLTLLRPIVWKRIGEDAGNKIERILDLEEDELSTVVGTLVFRVDDNDIFLEDESGRVAVKLADQFIDTYVTGSVLGLTGKVVDGVFDVETITTPAKISILKEQKDLLSSPNTKDRQSFALFLSGTECGSPNASSFPRDMLISYLQGLFGTETAAGVSHVYVAGNLIAKGDDVADGCRDLDAFCWELTKCAAVPVTLLPGKTDPTTANWPQRPLHRALIPNAASTVKRATNPMATKIGQSVVIATDGANADSVDAMIRTLECSHICPQGPSEVPTVPNVDPMVITIFPNIYVAGNCPSFDTRLVNINDSTPCRVICLPKFIASGEAVLVNLETLCVELLRFDATDLE